MSIRHFGPLLDYRYCVCGCAFLFFQNQVTFLYQGNTSSNMDMNCGLNLFFFYQKRKLWFELFAHVGHEYDRIISNMPLGVSCLIYRIVTCLGRDWMA